MRPLRDLLPVRRAGPAVAAAALLLLTAPLRADTVTAEFTGVSPSRAVSVALGADNFEGLQAGYFNWNYVSGNPAFAPTFRAFCFELGVNVNGTVTMNLQSPAMRLGGVQEARMREFWGERYAQVGNDADRAAAFQLGVWEIAYEAGALDINSGAFRTLTGGPTGTDPAVSAITQGWLSTIDGVGPMDTGLVILDAATTQDQITTVPVPPAVVLGGIGLASLIAYGFWRRRLLLATPARI